MSPFWMAIIAQIVMPAIIQAIAERSGGDAKTIGTVAEIASDPKAAAEKIIADPAAKATAITVVSGWLGGILDLLADKKK
jgi:hypothetical protein